ncbi:MAG: peptidase [Gammaproteobacteria bacterium]|nr:peptidase [Gammaproteobacteria bacterium]
MHIVILIIVVVALLFGPQLWVQWVMRRHSAEREDFPGTGGEFARHLLQRLQLDQVGVEETERGDHYDPVSRTVRLSPDNFNGRSLTAVVVAAHEVGHAIQHAGNYRWLSLRHRLVPLANSAQQLGNLLFFGIPVIAVLTRAPSSGLLLLVGALLSFGAAALVHLITLPVEFDASFNRALPLLKAGRYIPAPDQRAAHSILRAAAMTYVAASFASLLNLWRWLRVLRRA